MDRHTHICEECGTTFSHVADCPAEGPGLEFYCDAYIEEHLGGMDSWSPDETGMSDEY